METEDGAAAGVRVQKVRERAAKGGQVPRQAFAISGSLNFHFRERFAGLLGFHYADGVSIRIQ